MSERGQEYICGICDETFDTEPELREHERTCRNAEIFGVDGEQEEKRRPPGEEKASQRQKHRTARGHA